MKNQSGHWRLPQAEEGGWRGGRGAVAEYSSRDALSLQYPNAHTLL